MEYSYAAQACFQRLFLLQLTLLFWHHLQGTKFSKSEAELYFSELISASPSEADDSPLPVFPQLKSVPRILPLRIAAMSKILVSVVLL